MVKFKFGSSRRGSSLRGNKGQTIQGGGCLGIFFFIFFAVGLLAFYFLFMVPVFRVVAAIGWQETPCTIVSSEVETHAGDDGSTYSVRIVYNYDFDGRHYESDRYKFMIGSSSGRSGKQAVVDRYPPGSKSVCYVNPSDPTQAVINRDFTADMLFGLLPLIFLAIGLGGLVYTVRSVFARKAAAKPLDTIADIDESDDIEESEDEWLPEPATVESSDSTYGDFGDRSAKGPVTLRSKSSPVGTLIAAIVICLFWNGIVSIFVSIAVASFRNGNPEWFLTVFLIPFVLVGLALVGFLGHSFLAIFNPRPTVTISSAAVPLGDTVELSWRFSGNTGSIRRLRIYVQGQEEARYRRGTKTHTDTEKFAELTVIDTHNFVDIPSGKASLTIPDDTMHSFESTDNKIVWTIHVAGEIAWWPDVNESYPMVILPKPIVEARKA
jgi:hypothetical protein